MTEQLEKWKNNGPFIINDRVVEILYYVPYTGESSNEFEIYFKDGSSLITDVKKLANQMKQWHPIHKQAVLLAKENMRKHTALDGNIVCELRETVLEQIRKLKEDPSKEIIAQTKTINECITTLANVAKVEIEFRKQFRR